MSHIPPDYARSPVFDAASRPHPGLVRSGSSWGMGAAVVGACVLGVITFVSLSNHRTARQTPAPQVAAIAPPAPVLPKPAPVMAPPTPVIIQAAAAPTAQVTPQVTSDPHAPAMVVDFSQSPAAGAATTTTTLAQGAAPGAAKDAAGDDKLSADEPFRPHLRL